MSRTRPATGTRAFKVTVWRTFLQVQHDVLGEIEKELAERHRLSVSEFDTLVNIPLGGIRLRELKKQVVLTQSAVSRLCDRLVDRGLVSRSPVADDARGATIRLTGAGRKLIRSAARTNAEVVERMFADRLSQAQLESLHEILAQLHTGDRSKGCEPTR
ncbi:MarR family winged helix-turn-helix transcriptional regulator [Streptomyces sp. NPDC001276]|uniref:MarR family winged helix-turn-helix transcriptional regulator n=1 Tax=Streptomyces sp. NPDC001276 TaxID=3364555 RepID=UPI0036AB524C